MMNQGPKVETENNKASESREDSGPVSAIVEKIKAEILDSYLSQPELLDTDIFVLNGKSIFVLKDNVIGSERFLSFDIQGTKADVVQKLEASLAEAYKNRNLYDFVDRELTKIEIHHAVVSGTETAPITDRKYKFHGGFKTLHA